VTTWLFGISMRVARDRLKLAYSRRRVDDERAITECIDEQADVSEVAERRQAAVILEALLDELPIEQRAVFTLFELDSMTGDQIAELLEIPLGTVYSRLRLAREAFQRGVARLSARDRGARPAPSSETRVKQPPRKAPVSVPPRASGFRNVLDEPEVDEADDRSRGVA
jgi:RNA polymerase sigma-70 factor (ECF subfamily)